MEISDVRIKLVEDPNNRLKAVCSITLENEFVVRDLKVVEGTNGLFVAMPSRKLSIHCPACGQKNHLKSRFCNDCGAKVPPARIGSDSNGRFRLHRDIAHPISPTFREKMQQRVIDRYTEEMELAKNPDYAPADIDQDFEEQESQAPTAEVQSPAHVQAPARPRTSKPAAAPAQTGYDFTDYDALIAGLRGGGKPMPESEPAPVRAQSNPRSQRQSNNEGGPRGERPAPPARRPQGDRPAYAERNSQPDRPIQAERPAQVERPAPVERSSPDRTSQGDRPQQGDRPPQGPRPMRGQRDQRGGPPQRSPQPAMRPAQPRTEVSFEEPRQEARAAAPISQPRETVVVPQTAPNADVETDTPFGAGIF